MSDVLRRVLRRDDDGEYILYDRNRYDVKFLIDRRCCPSTGCTVDARIMSHAFGSMDAEVLWLYRLGDPGTNLATAFAAARLHRKSAPREADR